MPLVWVAANDLGRFSVGPDDSLRRSSICHQLGRRHPSSHQVACVASDRNLPFLRSCVLRENLHIRRGDTRTGLTSQIANQIAICIANSVPTQVRARRNYLAQLQQSAMANTRHSAVAHLRALTRQSGNRLQNPPRATRQQTAASRRQ